MTTITSEKITTRSFKNENKQNSPPAVMAGFFAAGIMMRKEVLYFVEKYVILI